MVIPAVTRRGPNRRIARDTESSSHVARGDGFARYCNRAHFFTRQVYSPRERIKISEEDRRINFSYEYSDSVSIDLITN